MGGLLQWITHAVKERNTDSEVMVVSGWVKNLIGSLAILRTRSPSPSLTPVINC